MSPVVQNRNKHCAIFIQKLRQKSQSNILDSNLGAVAISTSRKPTLDISRIAKLEAKALISTLAIITT